MSVGDKDRVLETGRKLVCISEQWKRHHLCSCVLFFLKDPPKEALAQASSLAGLTLCSDHEYTPIVTTTNLFCLLVPGRNITDPSPVQQPLVSAQGLGS